MQKNTRKSSHGKLYIKERGGWKVLKRVSSEKTKIHDTPIRDEDPDPALFSPDQISCLPSNIFFNLD